MSPGGSSKPAIRVAAKDVAFDKSSLTAPAGKSFEIAFNNKDRGVPHNISIYTDASATKSLFAGEIFLGPEVKTYNVPPLETGSYFFRCDFHMISMTGALVVK